MGIFIWEVKACWVVHLISKERCFVLETVGDVPGAMRGALPSEFDIVAGAIHQPHFQIHFEPQLTWARSVVPHHSTAFSFKGTFLFSIFSFRIY